MVSGQSPFTKQSIPVTGMPLTPADLSLVDDVERNRPLAAREKGGDERIIASFLFVGRVLGNPG